MDAIFLPALIPDENFRRFPGGCSAIGKGDKRPKHPPPGQVYFPLNTLMEDYPLSRVPNPGGELSGRTVGLAALDNSGNNTFQIGKGFNR
jgi:hypothetical protein